MPRHHDAELLRRVGVRLRAARQSRSLTQTTLAEALDVESETISRAEHGHVGLSLGALGRAAVALGVPLRDLVDDGDDRPDFDAAEGELLKAWRRLQSDDREVVVEMAKVRGRRGRPRK